MNLFELAVKNKWRFQSVRGELMAEQLFDLPLTSREGFDLNTVATSVHDQLEKCSTKNFVAPVRNTQQSTLELKLEFVKLVIADKLESLAAAKLAAERSEERQKILAILNRKNDEKLESASEEDLRKRLAELETQPA